MKKTLLSATILVLATMMLSSAAYGTELILTYIRGQVEVKRSKQEIWTQARTGTILKSGDTIRTGRRSRAKAFTREGHKITIKQKTVLKISKLGPREWDFKQKNGRARFQVSKLRRGQTLKVRTPTAVCAVRGTIFEVTILDDMSTILNVFEGMVSFGDVAGQVPEIPVMENQRSTIQEGAPAKEPEQIPEQERMEMDAEESREEEEERKEEQNREGEHKQEGEYKDARMQEGEEGAGEQDYGDKEHIMEPQEGQEQFQMEHYDEQVFFGDSEGVKDEFRQEIEKEISLDLVRDHIEAEATFELQANQYQEAKTLIDAFGQRVRLEEYLTRPTPESFKFVALNTREKRFDFAFFEVVANKALPENLDDAGNLWFSLGDVKPEFYAVKQRWFVSNQVDTVTELSLDGDSKPVNFQEAQFSETGDFLGVINERGFETIFDHTYEFINGNPEGIERIWNDNSFRPLDNGTLSGIPVTGMMFHERPVLVEIFDPSLGVVGSFWDETFVTTSGSGNTATGKIAIFSHEDDANPFLAHFVEKINYINFVDTNANGRLDRGESFLDLNNNGTHDANEPFEDVVQLGFSGSRDDSRIHNDTGDTIFFSDLNRDGLNNDGNAGPNPLALAASQPWAWQIADEFMVNDLGEILDFRDVGLAGIADESTSEEEFDQLLANAFEKVNFQRVFQSSEFDGRKIDIVLTPRIILKAGLLEPERGDDAAVVAVGP